MTVTDRTDASPEEFRDRIAAFETAPTPPEVREAAVVEEVARAIYEADPDKTLGGEPIPWGGVPSAYYRRLAAAAVAAYRATQDGGAEEAVRRVEALVEALDVKPTREDRAIAEGLVRRARAAKDYDERDAAREAIALEIATERALAPQAGDGAR